MRELSLEAEFEIYKMMHKTSILQAKLITYYQAKEESGIRIPFFMTKTPEQRAQEDVENLLCKAPHAFEQLYERAWNEFAECLP